MLLGLSIVAILLGPLILQWFPENRRLDNFLFSFVLIAVGGILVTDILPMLWQHIGLWLFPLALLGFFGPSLIESSFRNAADQAHKFALLLGLTGLALHSLIDGIAVIDNHNSTMIPYAVILHRLIVGLSIWWLVEPIWGKLKTLLIFILLIVATVIGYVMANQLGFEQVSNLHNNWLDYFQALVAGTLLHVIIHRPHIDEHGHKHDHGHALAHDPNHSHSHGIVIKHKVFFLAGAIAAVILLLSLHQLH